MVGQETRHTASPEDPRLLPSQIEFKSLSDSMVGLKMSDRLAFVNFDTEKDPQALLLQIQESSLKDMLLQPGESFSITPANDHYRDLGMAAGEVPANSISLTHWDWNNNKWRTEPRDPQDNNFTIVKYPNEKDWARQIDINIWFGEGDNMASQRLSLFDSSRQSGTFPLTIKTSHFSRSRIL